MSTRRRSPGEGSIVKRTTKAGVLHYGIKFDAPADHGSRRQVLRWRDQAGNQWLTEKEAQKALRGMLGKIDRGTFVEPSRQPFGELLNTYLDGLRLASSTIASYRKNIRLHVDPYPIAAGWRR